MPALALPWGSFPRLTAAAIFDILIVAVIIYYFLHLIQGTRAIQMLLGVGLVVVFYYASRWGRLETVQWLLTNVLPYFVFALIVVFQAEIRRALARMGQNPFWRHFSAQQPTESYDDVILAASYLAQNRTGALMVIERDMGLKTYVESGVGLDALLSYDLLISIFRPESPLHDGAAIIQRDRVAAAACFLPLSLNPVLSTQLGTRHRAAIGVTEETDAVTVVISEQTGLISLCLGGTIEIGLSPERLADRLAELLQGPRPRVGWPSPSAVAGAATESSPPASSGPSSEDGAR
ncbi:MAG TPA: diadenylate cyclase CdaA [Candidatus Acidoferrales bacterium]